MVARLCVCKRKNTVRKKGTQGYSVCVCVCVWGRDEGSRISYLGLEAPFSLAFHGRAAPLAVRLHSLAHRSRSFRRCPGSKAVVSKSTLYPPSLSSRFSRSVDRDFREEIELSRMIRFSSFRSIENIFGTRNRFRA